MKILRFLIIVFAAQIAVTAQNVTVYLADEPGLLRHETGFVPQILKK